MRCSAQGTARATGAVMIRAVAVIVPTITDRYGEVDIPYSPRHFGEILCCTTLIGPQGVAITVGIHSRAPLAAISLVIELVVAAEISVTFAYPNLNLGQKPELFQKTGGSHV